MSDNRGFLTLNEYQDLAGATNKGTRIFTVRGGNYSGFYEEVDGMYNAAGMAGEAGECLDKIKKAARDGVSGDNYANYREEVGKEIGDVLWYTAALCTTAGFDMGEVMQENIDKLLQRYPDGYTSADSVRRVDVNQTGATPAREAR